MFFFLPSKLYTCVSVLLAEANTIDKNTSFTQNFPESLICQQIAYNYTDNPLPLITHSIAPKLEWIGYLKNLKLELIYESGFQARTSNPDKGGGVKN